MLAVAGLMLIVLRLFWLQVIQGGYYAQLASQNAAKIIPSYAPRGIIYDRFGKVLVSNKAVFSVFAVPNVLQNADLPVVVRRLSLITGMAEVDIYKKLGDRKNRAFEPILIKDNLNMLTVTRMEEEKGKLNGIFVQYRPVRYYHFGSIAAHVLGYVGEIEANELQLLKGFGYRLGDIVGKEGVEKTYDDYLRGINGGQKIAVDVRGRPIKVVGQMEPIPGKDVYLTLDIDLQKIADKALGNQEGAVVVLDIISGEVLALASHPNFDPNIFSKPLTPAQWAELSKKKFPFMNRALSVYPPGSIFKVITLSAALQENLSKPSEMFNCPGFYRLGSRIARCWLESGHGKIGLLEGLVWSCDIVFYEMGRRAGIKMIGDYGRAYGLGSKTEIDLPQEKNGLVPDLAWKQKALNQPWYEGDAINIGIGQGFLQVTPLQMANVYAAIACGKRFVPHVLKRAVERSGKIALEYEPRLLALSPISEKNMNFIRHALREAVRRATGVAARVAGLPAAGKTGTAENPGKAHAWFICYAPYRNPEIVVACFVAHGEHGDRASARIAKEVLAWYKDNRYKTASAETTITSGEKNESDEEFPAQYILHETYKEPYRRAVPSR